MRRILVCVDLSPVTDAVMAFATALSASLSSASSSGLKVRVELLHVADPEPAFVSHDVDTEAQREVLAAQFHDTHRAVEARGATMATASGAEVHTHVVRGSIVDTIVEQAKRLDVEVIVVGSNGHNRLRSLLIGSVTDALLRRSTLPVVVVPGPRGGE